MNKASKKNPSKTIALNKRARHEFFLEQKFEAGVALQGFDAVSLTWFKLKDGLATKGLGRRSPLWNTRAASDHTAHDGLWLVEPHAGSGAVGAKWEEILVVQDGHAQWLDSEPPHVRQWMNIAAGGEYSPGM